MTLGAGSENAPDGAQLLPPFPPIPFFAFTLLYLGLIATPRNGVTSADRTAPENVKHASVCLALDARLTFSGLFRRVALRPKQGPVIRPK
jgi:hypothetical protein